MTEKEREREADNKTWIQTSKFLIKDITFNDEKQYNYAGIIYCNISNL